MDQMQQTVMESMESGVSFPQETNSTTNTNPDMIPGSEEGAYEPLTYDELFPELPNAKNKSEEVVNNPASNWTRNSDMRIASSINTHMFRVPFEERAKIDASSQFGESASSRICADITAKTGAHIEISTAKDQSLTFLITGKVEEVLKAKRLALDKFQTQARQSISIPKEHHRYILGKKGKKLQDLEAMSGTKIQVPIASDPSEDIVVMGTKDSIEKAVHEIRLISDEQSKQGFEKLEIPKTFHPFINPMCNDKLNQLVMEKGIRINLPPPSVAKDEITIAGEKEGVLQCRDLMNKIYQEMQKKCQTVSVEVKKSQHKYVIGPRGSNITEILQKTNVSVEMPPPESSSETVTLRGPQDKLGQALTMVYEKASSMVIENVEAPHWLHKFIIGRKGANIKVITQDLSKVHLVFTDEENCIKLEGPQDEVNIAREKLEQMVAEKKSKLSYDELVVDPQYYKYIIGKNGSNINRIRNDNDVHINISEVDGKNLIRVEGKKQGVLQAKQEMEEMVTKIENERERDITIENRFHRTIIGTKGEKIKEIRERFNQVQIIFPDLGKERSDTVKIRGPKEDVDQCYRYLQKLNKELLETNYQMKVSINRQCHKFIIGKGGSNINKIREETNTKIELPSEGQNSDDIIITGRKEHCAMARDRIQKIQSEQANTVEVDILIPGRFHNSIIGAGGKLIQSISEECGGVAIKFPSLDSKSDKVSIRGSKEDVQKAKQMLVELSQEKQLSSCTAEVKAKPELYRFLIGRNGANIKKIREKTGARIIFPTEKDENKEIITIIGRKEAVEKAQAELKTLISELDKVVEMEVSVEPRFHRHFVARRGEVLRHISDQFAGVTISFPRQGVQSDKVVLKGMKEAVAGAKARLLEIVSDLEQMVTIEVSIPQKFHRTVMGARGKKVQDINWEFDVQIKFPEKDAGVGADVEDLPNGDVNGGGEGVGASSRPQDVVVIQGRREKCEAAKAALLALVPVTASLTVPFKYHRFIIGTKGDAVRKLMSEFEVVVQVPPAHDQSDAISVTGPPANVDAAKDAIEKKVRELADEDEDRQLRSFKLTLNVDPEYHPKIIGRKGAVISKIRDKFDVNIQFPARGAAEGGGDDVITITGYREKCEAAREAILAITGDLDSMVRRPVEIDPRIHSRLIGSKGRAIRKIMDEFKVEIKFPRGGDDPSEVTVMGVEENVDECIDHLLNLTEEYMQDIVDQEQARQYTSPPSSAINNANVNDKGFVVAGAPWTQPTPNVDSSEDFPSMGNATSAPSMAPWGPRRA